MSMGGSPPSSARAADDTYDDGAAIPAVVRSSLGSGNIEGRRECGGGVVCGLEAFLLPRYLSLRAGSRGSLPEVLRKANEEEEETRRRRCDGNSGKGAVTSRKRRKKTPREYAANATGDREGERPPGEMRGIGGNRVGPKSKRRKRRRRSGPNTGNGNDHVYHQIMARIIVAPYAPALIATVDRSKKVEEKEQSNLSPDGPKTEQNAPATASNQPGTLLTAATKNVYIKSHAMPDPRERDILSISPPQESLESVVDGALCALVRRTHRFRTHPSSSADKLRNSWNWAKRKPRCRRRGKRKRTEEGLPENQLGPARNPIGTRAEPPAARGAGRDAPSANDWLLERNLLSTGYALGSGGDARLYRNPRGCPNMAPGVHCVHPNPLVSYARSSRLASILHSAVGDDALREILMNCVVLVPAVSSADSLLGSGQFDRGNYFQLCGPPLNHLAKKFDEIMSNLNTRATVRGSKVLGDGDVKCDGRKHELAQSKQWDPNRPIPRGHLFYCDFYAHRIGLSPSHLLNQDDAGPSTQTLTSHPDIRLLDSMVQLWPRPRGHSEGSGAEFHCNKRRGRWRRLRESGVAMCRELRRRHRRCDYNRLLEHHCPLPLSPENVKKMDVKESLAQHVTLHTPSRKVGSFLEAVLRSAFPTKFWGSLHNFRQVVETAKVFVKLHRAEQFPEKAIVSGVRVLDMRWLLPNSHRNVLPKKNNAVRPCSGRIPRLSRSDHESTAALVRGIMRWLYCQFIIPLLRSTFYLTETEFTGNRVVYYRRPIWARIRSLSARLLLRRQYREIDAGKAQKLLFSHNVGIAPTPLRLLPKKTGVRAIAMLSKSCSVVDSIRDGQEEIGSAHAPSHTYNEPTPPNRKLRSIFQALRYEHGRRPSLFGAGVLGLAHAFPSFCLFAETLKKRSSRSTIGPGKGLSRNSLFFASVDIKHCYDTINQKRLFNLIRSVIEEDAYMTKTDLILHHRDSDGPPCHQWRRTTFPPHQFSSLSTSSNNFAKNYFSSLFVDGVRCSIEKREKIMGLLRDHIFGQVVVASSNRGPRYLLQKDGIPQGSILSSMFCNIYFGNVEGYMLDGVFERETSVIRGTSSPDCDVYMFRNQTDIHLLVRIVDDFLLISTNEDTSIRFMKKLNRGVPSLGVKINNKKSRTNYPLTLKNETGNMEVVASCLNGSFPWCGLLINTETCEISLDWQRFSRSNAIDTVMIHRTGNEGSNLKKKMKDFVRPRCCQKLLFSSRINGINAVRLNFYQTILLCALKSLHYIKKMGGIASSKRREFVYESACDTVKFAFLLISSKLKHGKIPSHSMNGTTFELMWEDASWLGKHAFFSIFRSEGNQFSKLCHLFAEPRACNRNDLLLIPRKALKLSLMKGTE